MLEQVVPAGTGTSAADRRVHRGRQDRHRPDPRPRPRGLHPRAPTSATFAGFAPAQHPVLSAIVVLDRPTPIYGGAVAAPVFSTIMPYALHRYGIPTTAAATTAASTTAVGGTGSVTVPAGAVTEGP